MGAAMSHAGRAAAFLKNWGVLYLASIMIRKALYNLQIMFSSNGLYVFGAFVIPICLWLWKLSASVSAKINDRYAKASLKALLWGCLCAFICNDSGITMAGIMLGLITSCIVYSLLEEKVKP